MKMLINKQKKYSNILTIVLLVVLIGIITGYNNNQFSYDDGYMSERFSNMFDQYGVFSTIVREFFNMDLAWSGEMRFYGLSKAIHVILYLIAGDHVGFYTFVMVITHFLGGGGILYNILKFFHFDKMTIFVCVSVWCLSPFAHVQTFHHFSYLFIPLYFVMVYFYFNLISFTQIRNGLINFLLIFCCMFTGENTIPLFGLIVLMFVMHAKLSGNKEIVKKYIGHILIAFILGISWILLWKYKICKVEGGRFTNFDFSFSRLWMLKRSFVENFKYFLWLGDYKYEKWTSLLKPRLISIIIFLNIMALILIYWNYLKAMRTDENEKISIDKFLIGAIICFVGLTIVYIMLNVCMGYEMALHYFYTIYTVLLCIIVIFLNYIPNKAIKRVINGFILFIVIVLNVFWNGILMPVYGMRNQEIESKLDVMKNDYTRIVVITEGNNALFGRILDRGYWYRPRNAFSEAWASESLLNNYFDEIIFVPEQVLIHYDRDDVYLEGTSIVYQGQQKDSIVVSRNSTCFMYVDYKNDWKISAFNEFYANKLIRIFSAEGEFVNNINLMFNKQILMLEGQEKRTSSDGITITAKTANIYKSDEKDTYFDYNKNTSGMGEMLFEINGIPEEGNISLFMDFNDFWSHNSAERVFDINIEIGEDIFVIKDFDIYDLGGNKPIRAVVRLPKVAENIGIRFIQKDYSDVAMVQVIGLISE